MEKNISSSMRALNFNFSTRFTPNLNFNDENDCDFLIKVNRNFKKYWVEPMINNDAFFKNELREQLNSTVVNKKYHYFCNQALLKSGSLTKLNCIHNFYVDFIKDNQNICFEISLEQYLKELFVLTHNNYLNRNKHFELLYLDNVVFFYNGDPIKKNTIIINDFILFLTDLIFTDCLDFETAKNICLMLNKKNAFDFKHSLLDFNVTPIYCLNSFISLKTFCVNN